MKNDERNGFGIYKFSNGDIYEGEWKNGNMEGHGIYIFKDGAIFEGQFKDGQKNGHGILKLKDGNIYEGEWEDDIIAKFGYDNENSFIKIEDKFKESLININ